MGLARSFDNAALGAGALLGGGNLLLGSELQAMPGPGKVYIIASATAAGITVTVRQGLVTPINAVTPNATNAPPRNREDVVGVLTVRAGEQPVIDVLNTTGGALGVWFKVVWLGINDIRTGGDRLYGG